MNWKHALGMAATVLGFFGLWFGLAVASMATGRPLLVGLPIVLVLGLFYGWVLYAFLHYRQGRQAEVLHLLTTAADAGLPLAPVLSAYVADRPRGAAREFWMHLLLFFVLPGYYGVWHRRHSFDARVAKAAGLLRAGVPLAEALRQAPGVVPAEVVLAADVGEVSGRLGACLRRATGGDVATVGVEVLPRVLYPLFLLGFATLITTFWTIYLLPRLQRIAQEMDTPLPELTLWVARFDEVLRLVVPLLVLALLVVLALACSSWVCWHAPLVGRLYRMHQRGRVLRMLSVLVEAGRPLPESLGLLGESPALAAETQRRLAAARGHVERGQPLADALLGAGLLTDALAPLVRAGERVRNLPWVLVELGDSLTRRAARLVRRVSQLVSPVTVMAVGGLVGLIVVGMFLPLVHLLTRMGE